MARHVIIVGRAPTRAAAPYDDPDCEIWGHGTWHPEVRRYDRWYELHNTGKWGADQDKHVLWLWQQDCPVEMFFPHHRIRGAVLYPEDIIRAEFGDYFLTSTAAWMLARAIYEKVDRIGLWGIDMGTETEYEEQRPGVMHFVLLARDRGIIVDIPPESALVGLAPPYPFHIYEGERNVLRTD